MPGSQAVISRINNVAVVTFATASLLDPADMELTARELYGLADKQAQRKIVLDFSDVNFLSSQMLSVILSLNKRCQAIGGAVVVCGLRPELRKVFEIANLDRILRVEPDEEAALNALGTSGSY
jgi:anti-sigma B factor antagonist